MDLRQSGVETHRLFELRLGEVLELEPIHQLAGEKVRSRGACGHVKGAFDGFAGLGRLSGLCVGHGQCVRELDIVWHGRARLFEKRNRLRDVSRQIVRKPEDLHGLASLGRVRGEFAQHRFQGLDRVAGVVGVVVRDPEQRGDPRIARGGRPEFVDGGGRLARVDELARVSQDRRRLRRPAAGKKEDCPLFASTTVAAGPRTI